MAPRALGPEVQLLLSFSTNNQSGILLAAVAGDHSQRQVGQEVGRWSLSLSCYYHVITCHYPVISMLLHCYTMLLHCYYTVIPCHYTVIPCYYNVITRYYRSLPCYYHVITCYYHVIRPLYNPIRPFRSLNCCLTCFLPPPPPLGCPALPVHPPGLRCGGGRHW